MTTDDLRPELTGPDLQAASVAFLDLVAWRSQAVAELRDTTGNAGLTVTSTNVLLHIFVFGMVDDQGSSEADIVNNLAVPRRTVRDSLAAWEALGMIVKEGGRYYPTEATAELYNGWFNKHFRLLSKLCGAFGDYRGSIGR